MMSSGSLRKKLENRKNEVLSVLMKNINEKNI